LILPSVVVPLRACLVFLHVGWNRERAGLLVLNSVFFSPRGFHLLMGWGQALAWKGIASLVHWSCRAAFFGDVSFVTIRVDTFLRHQFIFQLHTRLRARFLRCVSAWLSYLVMVVYPPPAPVSFLFCGPGPSVLRCLPEQELPARAPCLVCIYKFFVPWACWTQV